ncbi:MAG: adenosylcobinamide-phosphate synthase CbiB, partial [Gammaproteobacteria bacterium]
MAGALGIGLGGNAYYHGKLKQKPTLGPALKPIDRTTVENALNMKTRLDVFILALLAVGVGFFLDLLVAIF